jgi:hypothetical protein
VPLKVDLESTIKFIKVQKDVLFVQSGGEIKSYKIERLLKGELEPVQKLEIEAMGMRVRQFEI